MSEMGGVCREMYFFFFVSVNLGNIWQHSEDCIHLVHQVKKGERWLEPKLTLRMVVEVCGLFIWSGK